MNQDMLNIIRLRPDQLEIEILENHASYFDTFLLGARYLPNEPFLDELPFEFEPISFFSKA